MAGRWAKFPMARQGSKRGLGWPAQRSGAQARPFACLSRRPLLVALSIHWLACGGGGGGRWRSGGGVGSYHDASRDGVIRTHRGCAAAWKGSPSSSTRGGWGRGDGAACSDKAFEMLLFLFDARGLAEGRARVARGSSQGRSVAAGSRRFVRTRAKRLAQNASTCNTRQHPPHTRHDTRTEEQKSTHRTRSLRSPPRPGLGWVLWSGGRSKVVSNGRAALSSRGA